MGKLGKVCKDTLDRDNDGDVDLDDIKDIVESASDGMKNALELLTKSGGDAVNTLSKVLAALEGLHIEGLDINAAKQALQKVVEVITQVSGMAEHLKDKTAQTSPALTFSKLVKESEAPKRSETDVEVMSNKDTGKDSSKEKTIKPK